MTDEQLEKVAWLNRATHAHMKLKALNAYKENRLQDLACKGIDYENDGSFSCSNENVYEKELSEYCDEIKNIEKKIDNQRKKLNKIETEINEAIYAIGDDRLESVLIFRHLAEMRAKSTAKEINYSERNASRLYVEALEKLSCFGA